MRLQEVERGKEKFGERIYVVRMEMPTPEKTEYSRMIDDNTKEIKYYYPKDTRLQIERIRNKYKEQFHRMTLNFYGLQLVKESKVDEVRKLVDEANRELAEIDASLRARFTALPIESRAIEEGEMYTKMVYAIQYQVAREVFNRIKDIKSETPRRRTVRSVREMLEKLREINVVNDPDIDRWIDRITSMLNMKTEEIRKALLEELEYLEKELEMDISTL